MSDAEYVQRLVRAFTDLMRSEQRVELGFSEMARRFSEAAGETVSPQVMGRWLKGIEQPREARRRMALAKVLGVTVGWLFYDEKGPADAEPIIPPGATNVRSHPDPDAAASATSVAPHPHTRRRAGGN